MNLSVHNMITHVQCGSAYLHAFQQVSLEKERM